jgi:hypothetical protein
MTWKQQIDAYEKIIGGAFDQIDAYEKIVMEALDQIATIVQRVEADSPAPVTTVPPTYLSGRWKLRDGTMYGR